MSLINDALRRAAQQEQPVPSPRETQAGLMPVDYSAESSRLPLIIGVPVALLLLGAGWWFISQAKHGSDVARHQTVAIVASRPVVPAQAEPSGRLPENPTHQSEEKQAIRDNPGASALVHGATIAAPTAAQAISVTSFAPTETPTPTQANPAVATSETEGTVPSEPKPSVVATAAEAPATQPTFPALRLQGIYYLPTKASALINGKTLFVGDKIENAHVLSISEQAVTMKFRGQTNVIALP